VSGWSSVKKGWAITMRLLVTHPCNDREDWFFLLVSDLKPIKGWEACTTCQQRRVLRWDRCWSFLGVSFSLLAIQHTQAGIAATLMSIVPVLIIPPALFLFHEKVNWKEIVGALITVGGVAVFFL
jgi:drug/metabolite transporter (DMT)-like permease